MKNNTRKRRLFELRVGDLKKSRRGSTRDSADELRGEEDIVYDLLRAKCFLADRVNLCNFKLFSVTEVLHEEIP